MVGVPLGFRPRAVSTRKPSSPKRAILFAAILALGAFSLTPWGRADVIVSCGFEAVGDSWTYDFTAGDGCGVNTDVGAGDYPAGERIRSGAASWIVERSVAVIDFDDVLLSGWRNVTVNYHVSSTSALADGGRQSIDEVAAYVATTSFDDQQELAFGGEADVVLHGDHTVWGYADGRADYSIDVSDGSRSLKLRLYITGNSADNYWNVDDVAIEGVTTVSRDLWWMGGDGLWSNESQVTSWTTAETGGDPTAWNSANGDNAYFSQSGSVATIAEETTVAVRSISFAADGCRIDSDDGSSRLALAHGGSGGAGANTVCVAEAGHTATIDAVIIASPGIGLTKTGAGTLVLGTVNKYAGTTRIEEGAVCVSATNNLGAVGATVSLVGGTLRFAADVDLRNQHPFVFLADGGAIDTQEYNCSALTDDWSGSGQFTKLGAGTLSLQGANNVFSGQTYVKEGTLRLESDGTLAESAVIDVAAGAVLDVSAVDGGYRLGASAAQMLQGAGSIVGDLIIETLGVHALGCSPSVQCVRGDYAMNGSLEIELHGALPGDEIDGYDQVLIMSSEAYNVSLSGTLSLSWDGTDWASVGDQLWIVRNDTTGFLSGAFSGLTNGDSVGEYDGLTWQIYFGADADTGALTGGNDVLLTAVSTVPEPNSLALLSTVIGASFGGLLIRLRRKKRTCHPSGLC